MGNKFIHLCIGKAYDYFSESGTLLDLLYPAMDLILTWSVRTKSTWYNTLDTFFSVKFFLDLRNFLQ